MWAFEGASSDKHVKYFVFFLITVFDNISQSMKIYLESANTLGVCQLKRGMPE